jgi:hypothetical protein
MSSKTISEMTSQEIHEAVHSGMAEVARRLESGELDGSGRFYTDEELTAGVALDGKPAPSKSTKPKPSNASAA